MDRRRAAAFILLSCCVYFAAYIARLGYAAALVSILEEAKIAKSTASAAVTGLLIAYGLGQVSSGLIGDRISPRTLISAGLLCSSLCNVLIVFPLPQWAVTCVWCLNGSFQSLIWPPLLRALTEKLDASLFRIGNASVSAAANVATVAVYLLMPAAIRISGWRSYFLFAAVFSAAVAAAWAALYPRFPSIGSAARAQEAAPRASFGSTFLHSGLLLILAAALMQGILRDSVLTWMPSFLSETFSLDSASSILTTVILPAFSTCCIFGSAALLRRVPNEITCAFFCFLPALTSLCVLAALPASQILPTTALLTTACGSMHAVNSLITGQCTHRFRACGRVATVAGLVNACSYAGSALSTYGVAVLADDFGWDASVTAWIAAAALGTCCLALEIPVWMKWNSITLRGAPRAEKAP